MSIVGRILKYMPAVVLGLLVLAWVVSCFAIIGVMISGSMVRIVEGCFQGILHRSEFPWEVETFGAWRDNPTVELGAFSFVGGWNLFTVPIVALATPILPLTIGPFLSYRFRLWHHLAYTALVAVELAYYLRWQE